MTEIQNNIVGKVLMDAGVMTIPITEEWITMMVDSYEKQATLMGAVPLSETEKEDVITTLHSRLFVQIDRGHCLKEMDHTPWYMAAKANQPCNFWDRYRIYLQKEKHWNRDTVNELDKTTDEIMDLLGNPDSANSFLYRGLCIGDVQSGKTSTYIGLINKAADAHYRVVILLTGTIEKLRRQTQQRIDEGFIGLDSYAFTLEKDNVQVGVGSIDPNTSGWAVTSTTSDFNAATAKKIVGQLTNISAPVIFVLKKNKSVLEKLEHWLRFYNANKTTKLKKEVHFNSDWMRMIQDNTVNILGWIQYEKVKWLQNNNPEVPGLIYKLAPMDEKMRKLNNVRKLWEGILEVREVCDVFTGKPIITKQYDVDHFIPWSFVMNDELWNLMPMDSSLNSSKSNKLPKWDPFFAVFAENQYGMYNLIHERAGLHKLFEACYRDNLHSIWAGQELYRPGNSKEEFYHILQKNMQPVYDSARRQGYEIWNL